MRKFLLCVFLLCYAQILYGVQKPVKLLPSVPDISAYEKLVIHYRYDKPDSALFFVNLGMKLAKSTKDEEGMARMLNQMGMIDDNSGDAVSSRQRYLEALEIYKRLNNYKGIIKENIRLGVVENRKGSSVTAIPYFLQALKISEQNKDKSGIMESYITLGEVYALRHDYLRAISYYKRAEAIGNTLPFSSLKLNTCLNFGTAYRETGDLSRAIYYFEKGIGQSDYPEMMGLNISLTIGLAQVYAKSGATAKAIALQKGALLKSRKISNSIREFQSLIALAESYGTSNRAMALNYLQQALAVGQTKKANKQILEALSHIAALYEKSGDYKAAYQAKTRQYSIADSFYFKDISLKISNLQAQYELTKSQAKVAQLKFVNNQQLLEQKIMFGIISGGTALMLILGIYFFKIRNLNRLMNKANTDLIQSNNVKDKLFSILGHDLKAPLASILNLLVLINRGWLSDEEKSLMLSKLELQCNATLETLNLILRWGQMQLKGIMINQGDVSPEKKIKRNVLLLKEMAAQKSISIEQDIEPDLRVFCDADHLDFLVRNILSNAIKFTPVGGTIHIAVRAYQNNQVICQFKDSGIGIEPSRLESIFSVNNVSTMGTNNEKGTSLGLVICKEFINANEGNIWVESVIGEGSEFFFTLKRK
ncbi:tetratricopeptide repeat protein [Pedobacter cryoconitis]|uniref:tetratricopeptide repeat-containing sensor histidine kinase n=1 Tax=Pedobacter cryoconitis TaxID=188932 RepID=UPI00161F350A|nr:tetratricopeptide repeat protein [Pedobacter cryoconitis]MBB5644625.1 signal transduction histidine kinase [Pedobacter cryoconitis]